jgi:archaemetzincin
VVAPAIADVGGVVALRVVLGAGDSGELTMRSEIPGGVLDLKAVRAAGAKIRPLHVLKAEPHPGEWLDQHDEPGQTFDDYRVSDPNRPSARRTTIYLQPLGKFDAARAKLLDATADLLGRFYGVPVAFLDLISLDRIPKLARRVHPTWGDRQVLSTYLLDLLMQRRPEDAVAVLALTTSDLWPGAGWNFVFGEATLSERVGVWSLYRQGNPHADGTTYLCRTLKTAVHETGHMLGVWHCTAYECGMNGANHLPEVDAQPFWFCPEDEMKIWWGCRVDPEGRYERLAAFAAAYGLDREARFWKESLAALGGRSPRGPASG